VINALVFSKDRAMQLDAVLRSLRLHCRDADLLATTVLYAVSNDTHARHYAQLAREHPGVHFLEEKDFKGDILSLVKPSRFLLFLVDDNIFVREFSLEDAVGQLQATPQALAFSLRLGRNTIYSYAFAKHQKLPKFDEVSKGVLSFDWTTSERDFGYPFDVSSSIYRTSDMLPLLKRVPFSNPNTLEGHLDSIKGDMGEQNVLLCFDQSVTFANPINKVQSVLPNNRSGKQKRYTPTHLAEMFEQGYRIEVRAYVNFVSNGCHQEVRLKFIGADGDSLKERSAWQRWLSRLFFAKSPQTGK
jgi:hypothetical protein